jgi:hypothetical protein
MLLIGPKPPVSGFKSILIDQSRESYLIKFKIELSGF